MKNEIFTARDIEKLFYESMSTIGFQNRKQKH